MAPAISSVTLLPTPSILLGNVSTPRKLSSIDQKAKTFFEVAIGVLQDKMKDMGKLVSYTFAWTAYFNPNSPNVKTYDAVSVAGRTFKNTICLVEIVPTAVTVGSAVSAFFASPSIPNARNVWQHATKWVNTAYDGFSVVKEYVNPLSAEVFKTFTTMHYSATFGGSLNGAIQNLQDIFSMKKPDFNKTAWLGLGVARDVSFITLGALGLAATVGGAVLPPWAMLASVTSGLFFSLTGHFWKELVVEAPKGPVKA